MPSVFISHGAPSLSLDGGPARDFLQALPATLPHPRAILCISAHWETPAPRVTGSPAPETIHDFYGFPEALYALRYPSPGDPQLARRVAGLLVDAGLPADVDPERGLDHGAWVPLMLMAPRADVPVVQLSVQTRLGPQHQLAVGRALAPLRAESVLILGSGGATHNLGELQWGGSDALPPAFAGAFDDWLADAVAAGDEAALLRYRDVAPHAQRNHPTAEHFLPLFVPLGAAHEGALTAANEAPRANMAKGAGGRVLHRSFAYGSLSMAAFQWGT